MCSGLSTDFQIYVWRTVLAAGGARGHLICVRAAGRALRNSTTDCDAESGFCITLVPLKYAIEAG